MCHVQTEISVLIPHGSILNGLQLALLGEGETPFEPEGEADTFCQSASTIMTETVFVPGVNLALEPKSHDFDLLPCNVTHSMLCVLQVYCLTGTQIWMH